jgi:hypothetical protein
MLKTNYLSLVGSHWDFLPKFLSLHCYTTLEGDLGIQISGQAQGTIICLFGLLFFSQKGMTLKNLQKLSKFSEKLLVFFISSEFEQLRLKNSGSNQLGELKWIIRLLLKPQPSLEAEVEISGFLHFFLRFLTCGAT